MMKLSTFSYNFVQGLKNIWRNKMFSMASMATMAACIFLFGIFYSLGTNFSSMIKTAEQGVAVTVFFDEGISRSQIDAIGTEIGKRVEVSQYNFVSAEEAWETFKVEYFDGNEDLAAGFADDNPLANSENYEIYLNDVSMQPALVSFLEGLDGVRQVNQSEVAAQTFADVNSLLTVVFIGIIGVLLAVSVFLISNTVTVGISVRKEEIAIMKLIGAKDSFVRAPFIVEGIVIGLVGSAIPLGILYFLYGMIVEYAVERFDFLSSMVSFLPVDEIFNMLIPVSLALGVGIGWLGSRITLHKHLRV